MSVPQEQLMCGGRVTFSSTPSCHYYAMEAIMAACVHTLQYRVHNIYVSYKFYCTLCGGSP